MRFARREALAHAVRRYAMRSHIFGVLIALILSACTPGNVRNRVYATPGDGPAIVFAATETLSQNHMKRPDRVALLNAAVGATESRAVTP